MNTSILISTHGAEEWEEMAWTVAFPSAEGQGAVEVIVTHLRDGTLAEARNQGARKASGDWLCFLDADDTLDPGYLARMEEALPPEEGRWLLTPAVAYERGEKRQPAKIWPRVDLRHGNYLVIGTLVQAVVFEEVGGFREWGLYEDYDLFARCWIAGARVVEVPAAVYAARVRIQSRNRSPRRPEKLYWHQSIAHDLWPDLWAEPSKVEHSARSLRTSRLRPA